MPKYKWNNPQEWLIQKWQSDGVDEQQMNAIIREIILKTDSDTIQDICQDQMDADGYFNDLEKCSDCDAELAELYEVNPNHDPKECKISDCQLCYYENGGNICTHKEVVE